VVAATVVAVGALIALTGAVLVVPAGLPPVEVAMEALVGETQVLAVLVAALAVVVVALDPPM
jgi:hypothetical protein